MYDGYMKKKILVLLGHPDTNTYCGALAQHYADGAKDAGSEVHIIQLSEISFDPILHKGYKEVQPLEHDLEIVQEKITWADHIAIVYPTWWGGPPALLKGLIDRVLLPGFGFNFKKNSLLWDKLLKGRSARIITTMDEPFLYYWLGFGAPGDRMMKRVILTFSGIKPVQITHIDRVRFRDETWLKKKLEKIKKLAHKDVSR